MKGRNDGWWGKRERGAVIDRMMVCVCGGGEGSMRNVIISVLERTGVTRRQNDGTIAVQEPIHMQ